MTSLLIEEPSSMAALDITLLTKKVTFPTQKSITDKYERKHSLQDMTTCTQWGIMVLIRGPDTSMARRTAPPE